MKIYRCEECESCIGHTCDVFMKDKDDAIKDCFKEHFKNYVFKKKNPVGINFSN